MKSAFEARLSTAFGNGAMGHDHPVKIPGEDTTQRLAQSGLVAKRKLDEPRRPEFP